MILNEEHLHRVLSEYVNYFRNARPHQGIEQRTPRAVAEDREIASQDSEGKINALPILGGLHHEYKRAA